MASTADTAPEMRRMGGFAALVQLQSDLVGVVASLAEIERRAHAMSDELKQMLHDNGIAIHRMQGLTDDGTAKEAQHD